VLFTPDTVFEWGTAADLAVDVPVEVEGFLDENGILVAVVIEFLGRRAP
jgi:hypothetical protein